MDDNVWQCMQIFMWIFGIQTIVLIAVMTGLHTVLNKKIEKNSEKIDELDKKVLQKIDELDKKFLQKIDDLDNKFLQKD